MSTRIRTPFAAALAAALGLAFTATAQAQMIGTYAGTTSQGLSFSMTVADDGSGGMVFTGQTTQWNEDCHTGDVKFAWWGVGAWTPITGHVVTQEFRGSGLYEKVRIRFSGDTAHVNFQGREATFVDVNTSLTKTEECHSGPITIDATLQPPANNVAPHAGLKAGSAQSFAR